MGRTLQSWTELDRAEKEKEKRQKEGAAEGLNMLGDGRDRKVMLQKWAQRLRGKATAWQNVLIENGEAQPGLEQRIKGCRGEEVRQAVSKARYHLVCQSGGGGGQVQARMHAGQVPVQAGQAAGAHGRIPWDQSAAAGETRAHVAADGGR